VNIKIKRKFTSKDVEVGRDADGFFASAIESDFISMLTLNIVDNLPSKLAYTVRMDTIKSIVTDAVTKGITETLEALKLETVRIKN
jgi:hypothetical protein